MASFGSSKTTSGFSLLGSNPTTTFSGGGGDAKVTQTKTLFGATPISAASGFSLGSSPASNAPVGTSEGPNLTSMASFSTPTAATNIPNSGGSSFGLSVPTATTTAAVGNPLLMHQGLSKYPSLPSQGLAFGVSTPSSTSLLGSSLGSSAPATTSTQPTISFAFSNPSTSTLNTMTLTTSSAIAPTTESALSSSSSVLTYAQLEDAINKWTIDLEEQEKLFCNQAKQLNAWDRLLISNGEKVLQLNSSVEQVKHQQEQLDQELDFVLAQQKELENCIVPLEKELQDLPIQDTDRNETYQLTENLDSQLKQMSEDLKEVIEHLNESTKHQEISDPIVQISRILNAHMDSLQWIDLNTAQISDQLDQIAKMHEYTRHII